MLLLLSAILLVTANIGAAGVTYYVDSVGGNDANNGTSTSTAWRTFTNVNGRVFSAGDSILLKCGSNFTQGMTPGGSGTPASPITVGSYGTGAKPIVNPGTTTHGIFLWNQSGWVITGIEFIGGGIDKYVGPCGIYVDNSVGVVSYFRINNVVCHGQWYGISIGAYKYGRGGELMHRDIGNDNAYINDVVIDNVECYNNMGKGVHLTGNYSGGGTPAYPRNTNLTVSNSYFHDCGGDGIVIACSDTVLIDHVVTHNCGGGENDRYGNWPWSSANVTTQFCEACHCATPQNKGGGGFDLDYDCTNVTTQYCWSHDNAGPGCLLIGYGNTNPLKNAVLRYFVSQNDVLDEANEGGAILPYGTVQDSYIYNNTVYFGTARENTAAIWGNTWGKFGSMTNTVFKNNIIYVYNGAQAMQMLYSTSGVTFNNNCYYAPSGDIKLKWGSTVYSTLAAFRSATGQEANGIQANPMLNAPGTGGHGLLPLTAYQLQAGSPCINAGANVGLGDTRDYWGNVAPYNGVFDIGAYEYQGGAPPPSPSPSPSAPPPSPSAPPPSPSAPPPSPSPSPSAPPPSPSPGGNVMHVQDIYTCDVNGNPQTVFAKGSTYYWRVKIVNASGAAVSGAAVTTKTTKADGGAYSIGATTGADGWALFSKKSSGGDPVGTWTIEVTNVTKAGWTYDPNANVKTETTFTLQ